jgi:GT2 family glycosyltransferase
MADATPLSVVIPTIGRTDQLARTLRSLAACSQPAEEIVVVDQSEGAAIADLVDAFAGAGARRVACPGRGIGLALNVGLRAARNDRVAVTHDDCTVAEDWVTTVRAQLTSVPGGIVTGAVLPVGDPAAVPSTIDDPTPRDYTGTVQDGALFCNNMAFSRSAVLAIGGFDERLNPAAEDNDLCYRWLRSGAPFRYRPEMRVWHHDWRTPEQMRRLWRGYGRGQGLFYAKHLVRRDTQMLAYIWRDLRVNVPVVVRALSRRRRPPDWAGEYLLGLALGLGRGLPLFLRGDRLSHGSLPA